MAASGLKRISFLTPLAVLVLIFVLVNVVLTIGNQSLRVQLAERQQFITQSMQMEGLYREIIQTVASVAVKTKDEQLMSLLASVGIDVGGDPKPAGGAK
jgi:hypothetical protein